MCVSDERARLVRLSMAVKDLETDVAAAVGDVDRRRTTDVYVLGWLLAALSSHCTDDQSDQIAQALRGSAAAVRAGGIDRQET
jgi:hypothetical protein